MADATADAPADAPADAAEAGRFHEIALPAEDFPGGAELAAAFDSLRAAVDSGAKALSADLSSLRRSHYRKLSLLCAAAELAALRGVPLRLRGCPPEAMPSLKRLGFDERLRWSRRGLRRPKAEPFLAAVGAAAGGALRDFRELLGFVGELAMTMAWLARNPRKIQWQETLYYMDRSGADAVPIISLICALMGFILGWMGTVYLQLYGLKSLGPMLVGLSITKELGALMVAMVCIGRAGSAYAAEIATMKVSEELDAMEAMGLRPMNLVVVPKVAALTLVMPILTVLGDVMGILGGMVPSVLRGGLTIDEYYHMTVHAVQLPNFFEGVLKSFVFAFLVAAIGCFRGLQADNSAKGVGKATTSSVVSGIFLVVVADLLITMLVNK